jgi:hypothetical protein
MAHPIFERYPLDAAPVTTSAGPQPNPYHVYDGHSLWLAGTADLGGVTALLRGEQVVPGRTRSGRALMSLWAVHEPVASHGPHSELQFSFYVTHAGAGEAQPVADGPFAVLDFLMRRPGARQLAHGLWNDTPQVVAYNHEVLGLMPRLARSSFGQPPGRFTFAFHDAATGEVLATGDLRDSGRNSLAATLALFRTFGLRDAMKLAGMQEIETVVVNPVNEVLPRNADARTLAAPAKVTAQLFDASSSQPDRLEIPHPVYGALDFRPALVEHMTGFKLVYLNPA